MSARSRRSPSTRALASGCALWLVSANDLPRFSESWAGGHLSIDHLGRTSAVPMLVRAYIQGICCVDLYTFT